MYGLGHPYFRPTPAHGNGSDAPTYTPSLLVANLVASAYHCHGLKILACIHSVKTQCVFHSVKTLACMHSVPAPWTRAAALAPCRLVFGRG